MGVTCRVWSLSEGGSEDSEREREREGTHEHGKQILELTHLGRYWPAGCVRETADATEPLCCGWVR
jgi:hypothetical protein